MQVCIIFVKKNKYAALQFGTCMKLERNGSEKEVDATYIRKLQDL